MQTTGIIRKVDDLGRIVLPVEVRRAMGIQVGTELEILVENRRSVLEKMENCCIFCGARENLRQFFGKNLCSRCVEMLQQN